MKYPEFAKIGEKKYKINTDFRYALKCNKISQDENISDYERALAIIYTLFGEQGLNDDENYDKLLEIARKFLACGKKMPNTNEEPDMDYEQDEGYIRSSFQYDYQYDPYEKEYVHWWKYYNDLSNLSNNEFGSCCVLNRIRNLRNYDTKDIKDRKERERIEKAKKQVALKRNKPQRQATEAQRESARKIYEKLGL